MLIPLRVQLKPLAPLTYGKRGRMAVLRMRFDSEDCKHAGFPKTQQCLTKEKRSLSNEADRRASTFGVS